MSEAKVIHDTVEIQAPSKKEARRRLRDAVRHRVQTHVQADGTWDRFEVHVYNFKWDLVMSGSVSPAYGGVALAWIDGRMVYETWQLRVDIKLELKP